MTTTPLHRGMRGDDVRMLQMKLHRLGFDLAADGVYGDDTERAVNRLQALFGHRTDGAVSETTWRLIETEIRAGWNAKLPNAEELALRAQGRFPHTEGGTPTTDPRARAQALVDEIPCAPTTPDAKHTAVPTSGTSRVAPESGPRGAPAKR